MEASSQYSKWPKVSKLIVGKWAGRHWVGPVLPYPNLPKSKLLELKTELTNICSYLKKKIVKNIFDGGIKS